MFFSRSFLAIFATAEFRVGAASGLLLTVASPPSPLGFLGYVALVPLLLFLFSPSRVRVGDPVRWRTLVLSFGLVHWFTALHWLVLLGEASPLTFRWALPFMLLLLALYMTAFDAITLWVIAQLRKLRGAQAIWWFPGLWVLVEWLRALGDMGFPWLRLATTQLHYLPMLQVAGLFGELGVSLLVVWVNVLVALSWMSFRGDFPSLGRAVLNRWWAPVALVLLFAVSFLYGVRSIRELETPPGNRSPLEVGVVQANVSLSDKWDPAKRDSTFVPYTQLTRKVAREGARLVIWPETAVPLDLPRRPEYLGLVRDLVRSNHVELLTGFPERQVTAEGLLEAYNSSLLMDDDGVILSRYRKMHLLPLGERIPFQGIFPFLGKIDFGQAEWQPGPDQTVFDVDGHRFSVLICFESIFPRISRLAVLSGAGMLVNITNDGWYGDSLLPYQHASMSILRACENRVPLLRCANNGQSFEVLPSGRVLHRTRLFERSSFVTEVHPRPGGSFYTHYGAVPLILLIGLGFVFLIFVGRMASRPRFH